MLPIPLSFAVRSGRIFNSLVASLVVLSTSITVRAVDPVPPPIISYNPTITQVQGQLPISTAYPIELMLVVPNGSSLTIPFAVSLNVSSTTRPATVLESAVADFVKLYNAPGDLVAIATTEFSGSGVVDADFPNALVYRKTVHAKVNYPATAVAGTYAFKIFADNPLFVTLGVTNQGSEINGSVTAPVAPPANPPIVSISTPVNGSTIEVPGGTTFPHAIDFSFTATVGSDDQNPRPITSVSADINGVAISLAPTVLKPNPVTGLGTTSVTVNVSMLVTGVGAHIVTARATNDVGLPAQPDVHTFNVVILKTPLTVTADNKTRTYGSANPTFTYTITGFINGETLATSGVTGVPNVTTTATQFSPVLASGTYPITPSLGSLASSKYDFVFVNGGLTITKAAVTVAPLPATKVYGAPVPILGYAITGFLGSDTVAVVSGSPTLSTLATQSSLPGVYPSSAAAGTLTATNYSFLFAESTLTVTKALLTFTALDASRFYGASNPPFGFTVSGFVNNDTAATAFQGDPTLSTTATATSSVAGSTYPIIIAPDADLISTKYDFAFVNAGLTVLRAPLVVTADDKTKAVGAVNPPLTYTIAGLVNGETSSVLSVPPSLTTTATTASPSGLYPITNSANLSAANYSVSFVPGTLTVGDGTSTVSISGTVFFDVNANGVRNAGDPGLASVTVKLYQNNVQVAQTVTSSTGAYAFANLTAGTYAVDAIELPGLTSSTANLVPVIVSTVNVGDVNIGMALNFSAIRAMKANGFTIGFWKNNIEKAIAGKTGGTQVTAAKIEEYTTEIGSLALARYNGITKAQAVAIMSSTSSVGTDLLSKQLVASEYNYASGGYIGGNKVLTLCFITWGEYILENSASYSSAYISYAQKWFDAYNNSHGGYVSGPLP